MGKLLEWPITEEFIGKTVIFKGYTKTGHDHWLYEVGETYVIGKDSLDDIGPINPNNIIPDRNWGFCFELVEDNLEVDGCLLQHHKKVVEGIIMKHLQNAVAELKDNGYALPSQINVGIVDVMSISGVNKNILSRVEVVV